MMEAVELNPDAAVERTRARMIEEHRNGTFPADLDSDGDTSSIFSRTQKVQRSQARRQASPAPTAPSAPTSEIDFKGEHAAISEKVTRANAAIQASQQCDWDEKHGASEWINSGYSIDLFAKFDTDLSQTISLPEFVYGP